MCEHDAEMKDLLGSPAMNVEPDPLRMQAARERMMHIACSPHRGYSAGRTALTIGLLVIGVSAVGVTATQAGRDLVRWVFTSVKPDYTFTHAKTTDTPGSTGAWSVSSNRPLTAKAIEDIKAQHAEIDRMQQDGEGHLAGIFEGPICTTFMVEYTLSDGSTQSVGQEVFTPKQKVNMRADEILALRDAGAGVTVSERPGILGLGSYTIRFTLSDGKTVDLETNYPPGIRQDREKIFAETRELKKQLHFAVEDPRGTNGNVWGILHYALADGRTVGITDQVPREALTADGKQVALPASEATTNGWRHLSPEQEEAESLMEAGGGRLVGLYEKPNPNGSPSQWTVCQVEFTLASGQTLLMNEQLSEKQKASMRWDEISALRDAGAGQVLSQEPYHKGLGKYTVRFTLSDGQTVDLTTTYPPGTRQDREKIFAETRALKKQLRFTVEDPQELQGETWGLLRYTLADGRTVGIMEQVPKEALTPDGKHVAVPAIEGP